MTPIEVITWLLAHGHQLPIADGLAAPGTDRRAAQVAHRALNETHDCAMCVTVTQMPSVAPGQSAVAEGVIVWGNAASVPQERWVDLCASHYMAVMRYWWALAAGLVTSAQIEAITTDVEARR